MATNQPDRTGFTFWADDSDDSNAAVNGYLGDPYGSQQANDPNFWMPTYQEQQNAAFAMADFQAHPMSLEGQMSQLSTMDSMVPDVNFMNSMVLQMNSVTSMGQMDMIPQINYMQSELGNFLPGTYIVPAPQTPSFNIAEEGGKKKRGLTSLACGPCKKSHLKVSFDFPSSQLICKYR